MRAQGYRGELEVGSVRVRMVCGCYRSQDQRLGIRGRTRSRVAQDATRPPMGRVCDASYGSGRVPRGMRMFRRPRKTSSGPRRWGVVNVVRPGCML